MSFPYFTTSEVRPRKSARLRQVPGIVLKRGRAAFVPRGEALNGKARCLSEPQRRHSRRCVSNGGIYQFWRSHSYMQAVEAWATFRLEISPT